MQRSGETVRARRLTPLDGAYSMDSKVFCLLSKKDNTKQDMRLTYVAYKEGYTLTLMFGYFFTQLP